MTENSSKSTDLKIPKKWLEDILSQYELPADDHIECRALKDILCMTPDHIVRYARDMGIEPVKRRSEKTGRLNYCFTPDQLQQVLDHRAEQGVLIKKNSKE